MTRPSVVSVARIEPGLARRSWDRVRRLVAGDDPGHESDDLRCFIGRLRPRRQRGGEHRTRPPGPRGRHSRPPEPAHRRAGGAFERTPAETSDELLEDNIYMHTLPLATFAAIQRAPTARVTWRQDE